MEIYDLLFKLTLLNGEEAAETAADYLKEFCEVKIDALSNITAEIKGKSNYTIMLDAHIDEISMVVTGIDEKGFLKINKSGGVDRRVLEGCEVTVMSKNPVFGVFCNTPPHLAKEENGKTLDFENLSVDIGMNKIQAESAVSLGDKVFFKKYPVKLLNGRITSKALDNRAGAAAIINTIERLNKEKDKLPCNVLVLLSNFEEINASGAITGAFSSEPDEAVVVDVSFAHYPGIDEKKSAKMGAGAMLGISPILNERIVQRLKEAAIKAKEELQYEIMSGTTGTNSDKITVSRSGIPVGMLSIPLRNMHTPVEVVDVRDVESVSNILFEYVMSGGINLE